jgi:hypothetical protein
MAEAPVAARNYKAGFAVMQSAIKVVAHYSQIKGNLQSALPINESGQNCWICCLTEFVRAQ